MKFGQRHNAIIFPRDWLQTPVVGADAHLHQLMQRYAGEMLERRPRSERFADGVPAALVESLRRGQPATARVGRRLHMSERTLRRRLKEEDTSYKELLDDVRFTLASGYLAEQRDLNVAEIAFMLGFSQTPACSRAFKRWSGRTPVEYRAEAREPMRSAS